MSVLHKALGGVNGGKGADSMQVHTGAEVRGLAFGEAEVVVEGSDGVTVDGARYAEEQGHDADGETTGLKQGREGGVLGQCSGALVGGRVVTAEFEFNKQEARGRTNGRRRDTDDEIGERRRRAERRKKVGRQVSARRRQRGRELTNISEDNVRAEGAHEEGPSDKGARAVVPGGDKG
jgi:hypothetical protein